MEGSIRKDLLWNNYHFLELQEGKDLSWNTGLSLVAEGAMTQFLPTMIYCDGIILHNEGSVMGGLSLYLV